MSTKDKDLSQEPIAIVGMGCRFPGGVTSPDSYWALMRDGVDAIGEIPADRWDLDALYAADRAKPGKTYIRWGGFIDGIDQFDPEFFGISPREAAHIDPQQRLLLETAYEALEDAGEALEPLRGSRTGVYVGLFIHDYAHIQLFDRELIDAYTGTGTAMSIAANRVSYLFDLRGPSVALDTACSSSLVALHQGCESLRSGECNMVLAGGVNAILRPEMTVAMSKASMLSPDGRCHSFDADANGYVRAEGAGMVVLKRLSDALRDGNPIHAVIRSTALNQDGRTKGISVPNGEAQEALVREAHAKAGVLSAHVQYVEAHGTGTPVGDPIEANALGRVLSEGRAPDSRCVMGSVKSNMGHTESASGVAGLLKVVLALKHAQIPPNLHFHQANAQIDLDALKLRVPTELEPWPECDGPRLACVNSFGFGGTNAHAVIAQAPLVAAAPESRPGPYLLPLSAHTPAALHSHAANMRQLLDSANSAPIADVVYTAAVRRTHHTARVALVAEDKAVLLEQLDAYLAGERRVGLCLGGAALGASAPVNAQHPVFIFTGMGPQWWAMGRELLAKQPVFREAVEECDRLFRQHADWSLLEELGRSEEESRIQETQYAQPGIFAVQVGLYRLWQSLGVKPGAIIGHSVGEAAAAHAAGILSLEAAARVIFNRSRLQHRAEGQGRMLAIGMSEPEARQLILGKEHLISIAAINSPTSISLAGDEQALIDIERTLSERGLFARFLQVPVPYHSPAMDPLREELFASLEGLEASEAQVPYYSTILGVRVAGPELGAAYWWRNVRDTVVFAAATERLIEDGFDTFIEVGPHPVLGRSVAECLAGRSGVVLPSLRRNTPEREGVLATLGELYACGYAVEWERLNSRRPVVSLPAYPWQRERYWDESDESQARRSGFTDQLMRTEGGASHPLLGARLSVVQPTFGRELSALPYVADHQVRDAAVFPGAGYLEMSVAAALNLYGQETCCLQEVRFDNALFWPEEAVELRTSVVGGRVDIHSRVAGASGWTRHMSANLQRRSTLDEPTAASKRLDRNALQQQLPEELGTDLIYPLFEDIGLRYGASFQGITKIWRGESQVLAEVRAPETIESQLAEHTFHPAVLDACLHSLFCTMSIDGEDADLRGDVYLPVRLQEFSLYRRPQGTLYSVASLNQRVADQWFEGDISIYDESGNLVAEALGLRCQNLNRSDGVLAEKLNQWLYEYQWEASLLKNTETLDSPVSPMTGATWLIYTDTRGVGARVAELLRRRGQRAVLVQAASSFTKLTADSFEIDPRAPTHPAAILASLGDETALVGCVHLWSLDTTPGDDLGRGEMREVYATTYGSSLNLLKATLELGRQKAPRLWLVTNGAEAVIPDDLTLHPAQAPLWGFCRVAGNEQPELRCSAVDLGCDIAPSEVNMLVDELLADGEEDEIALRGTRRYVHRFGPVQRDEPAHLSEGVVPYKLQLARRGSFDGLRWQEHAPNSVSAGQLEIRVEAAGLNFKDVMKATGLLPQSVMEDNFWRRALGMECAGVVTRVSSGAKGFSVGDEVVAFAHHAFGSFATCDARLVTHKPEHLSFAEAATIPLAFVTAYYALHHLGGMRAGERVLIHAASGGVGQAAMMLARRAGAEIYATAGSEQKREIVRRGGARKVMDSRSLTFAEEINEETAGAGVDLILNSLTGDAIDRNLDVLADYGRFLELGKIDIDNNHRVGMRVLHRNASLHGVDLDRLLAQKPDLAGALLREVMDLFASEQLVPLPLQLFPAEKVADAFRYMAGAQHVGKVVLNFTGESVDIAPAGEIRMSAEATYVVSGGFGGFGLELLDWLVARGARSLVVLSRNGAHSAEARASLSRFELQGIRVVEGRVDLADEAAVAKVLSPLHDSLPPIKGVFHTAAILEDDLLRNQTLEQYQRVAASKLEGAWVLHKLTRHLPLDHFVLFSSVTSVLGNQGSGNYVAANCFVDSLAHYRARRGLPALTVNWGLIANVGMAQQAAHIRRHLERNGLIALHTRLGLQLLGVEMQRGTTQITIAPINWERWLKFHSADDKPRFARVSLASQNSTANGKAALDNRLSEQLASVEPEQRRTIAQQAISERVARVFAMAVAKIDIDKEFTALGLDSLMAIELRSRLEEVGIAISVSALLEGTTVASLVGLVLAAHAPPQGEEDAIKNGTIENGAPHHLPAIASEPPERKRGGWVVTPKPNPGAKLRLICFPYAGGAPTVFHSWADELPDYYEVSAINLPGRARRINEPAMGSIYEMAEELLPELLPLLDRPFVFFGHCMGSIIMYEVAQQLLAKHQLSPTRVFASGSMAPHLYLSPLVHTQLDSKFMDVLKLLDFTNTRAMLEDEEMRDLMMPTLRGDFEAVVNYGRDFTPRPRLRCPVTGFAAQKDLFAAPSSMVFWQDYTDQSFRLWMLDVHHYFVETHGIFLTKQIAADVAVDLNTADAPALLDAAAAMHHAVEQVALCAPPASVRGRREEVDARDWFTLHRSTGERRIRLYCFPSSFGRHPGLELIGSEVSEHAEICIVTPPQWAGSAPSIVAQARALAAALVDHADKPFAFFGHCTGAILMYEVAHYLRETEEREGQLLQPEHLFASGAAAPHLYVMPNAYLLSDEKLLELLEVIGHPLIAELKANSSLRAQLMPEIRADFEMMAGYKYRSRDALSCPITVIRARNDLWTYFYGSDPWRDHTEGAFELLTDDVGDHFHMETSPDLAAGTISKALGWSRESGLRRRTTGDTAEDTAATGPGLVGVG